MSVMSRPTANSEALVLRVWPCGETSVIASLLTRDHGYVKVIAKAARRPRSKLRALVEPGRLVGVEFSLDPHRELQYLRSGEVELDPMSGEATLETSAFLLGALELVDRCRPMTVKGPQGGEGPETSAMYEICDAYIRVLSSPACSRPDLLFFAFECELLARQGVPPELGVCAGCGLALADVGEGTLRFSAAEGGIVCGTCTSGGSALGGKPLSDDALTILMAISAAGVVGIMDWSGAASFNRSLRREIGAHLHRFLGYHLPGYRLPTALDLLRAGKEDGR